MRSPRAFRELRLLNGSRAPTAAGGWMPLTISSKLRGPGLSFAGSRAGHGRPAVSGVPGTRSHW